MKTEHRVKNVNWYDVCLGIKPFDDEFSERILENKDDFKFLNSFYLKENFYPENGKLPIFSGGLVGFFGYETIRLIENKLSENSSNPKHEIEDINLLISDKVMIFDNLEKTLEIVFFVDPAIANSYEKT